MFDRPRLSDEQIAAALRDRYGIEATQAEFLALGHDANAWTFRASASGVGGPTTIFLKVRRTIDEPRLALAGFLADHGVPEVVAPIPTLDGHRSIDVDGLVLIAYPFIEGVLGAVTGLTDQQWIAYGSFLRRLHAAEPPRDLVDALPHEDFVPRATGAIRELDDAFGTRRAPNGPSDPVREAVEALWRARREDIERLARGTDELGALLRERASGRGSPARLVVCHADVHTHNVLVTPEGGLRVIDWDDAMLAPPERDMMFVVGSTMGLPIRERELRLFGEGYGSLGVDPITLAYYRFDWVVQDIAGYAREALAEGSSPTSREYALSIFRSQFDPGADVDAVLASDPRSA